MKERLVPCPACRGPSLYGPSNPWRPFCSERCRTHDLGAWANEDYRVAAPPSVDESDDTGLAEGPAAPPPATPRH
jgi:endogenous inhibitor of DNA gyrase (YacG/DUF329 family)